MLTPRAMVTPAGYPFIGLAGFVTLVFAILQWPVLTIVGLIITLFCLNFFRDPERVSPSPTADPGAVVSPADGKVIKIDRVQDPVTGEERTAICVFMNVFNVHVNRMPVAGTVSRIQYHPGKFVNADFDKASTDNERSAMQITTEAGETFTAVQIAGLIARRIVSWVEEGDALDRGNRYGCIMFGSRVDLYIPEGYEVETKRGDKVLAGQTVLARKQA